MTSANDTNVAIQTALTTRPVTVGALTMALGAIVAAIFQPLGGNLTGSLPNPTIAAASVTAAMLAPGVGGNVTVVPNRTATGSTATTAAGDFLVCLNGPTAVQLETTPPNGTTHVLKDCRASSDAAIVVSPGGSDTIDGGSSLSFTNPHQAVTITYVASTGWENY